MVDISQLTSAHRIVFRSNGGNDTIVGTLREQDVIELEPGRTADEYEWEENEDGTTSVTCGGHQVTFRCEEGRRPNLCEVSDESADPNPRIPTQPETPTQPEQPVQPETPVQPEQPAPVTPTTPVTPSDPIPAASSGTRQPRPQGQLAQRDAPRR